MFKLRVSCLLIRDSVAISPDTGFYYVMKQDPPLRNCSSEIAYPRFKKKKKAILNVNVTNSVFFILPVSKANGRFPLFPACHCISSPGTAL